MSYCAFSPESADRSVPNPGYIRENGIAPDFLYQGNMDRKKANTDMEPQALSPELGLALPRVRLRLWLECGEELYFGLGRAQLLLAVDELGSLRQAASSLGMSYRAAWGKIQQSEHALGFKLMEVRGSRHEGVALTAQGREMARMFQQWFDSVEDSARDIAGMLFPFRARVYGESAPVCSGEERAVPES